MTAEEIDLIHQIKTERDHGESCLRLMEMHKGMIHILSLPYVRGGILQADEVQGLAFLALCSAVDGYDFARGDFINYYVLRLRVELSQAAADASGIDIPAAHRAELRRLRQYITSVAAETGHKPSDQQICAEFGFTEDYLHRLMQLDDMRRIASLDAEILTQDTESYTLGDTIADGTDIESDCVQALTQQQLAQIVDQIMSEMPVQEAETLRQRFYEGKPISDRKAYSRAVRRLKAPKNAMRLEAYLTADFHGTSLKAFRLSGNSQPERAILQKYNKN